MTVINKYCALCGSVAHKLHSQVEDYFFGASGYWDIYQCSSVVCSVAFPSPAPSDEVLAKAYESYYTHGSSQSWAIDTFKAGLARLAYAKLQFDWWAEVPLLGRLIEEGRLSSGSIPPKSDGIIGDIGCGSGDRLAFLQRVGWGSAVGVDPDPSAVVRANSLGRQVCLGSAEQLPWADCSIDAAILHHVIEHVRYPDMALREVLRVLKPGGSVALITPNITSITHQRRGQHWRGLEAPRHLTIFTLNALVKTVQDTGFLIECARSSARSGAWNDGESQRVQIDVTPKRVLRSHLRADTMFRQQSAAISRGEQIGDELLVVARRPHD